MQTVRELTVFEAITDFLATHPDDDAIMAYKFPEPLRVRLNDLLERNGEGLLSHDEQEELSQFIHAEDIMSLYKAKIIVKRMKTV